jgi:hypothetical protein
VADLLGGEGPSTLVAKDLFGVETGLGVSTSRTGLVAMRRSLRATSRMRSRIERHAITPLWLSVPSSSCCHRSAIDGVIWRSWRRPK